MLDLGKSFDLGVTKLKVLKKDVHIYYVNGLCDTQFIIEIMEQLVEINDHEEHYSTNIMILLKIDLSINLLAQIKTLDELVDQVLSGLIVVVSKGQRLALIVDVRSYPGTNANEPDTEKVVRGSGMDLLRILLLIQH